MAHELNFNPKRGTTSFFSRKEIAWHKLGQVIMDDDVLPDQAFRLANLDYEVALAPVFANFIPENCYVGPSVDQGVPVYDKSTNSFVKFIPKRGDIVPDRYATYRTDTYDILGEVGTRYEVVQNEASIEFIYNILKANPDISNRNDIRIETAGALGKGERMFVTTKLPECFQIGNETAPTNLYIVFTNSFDGKQSLTAIITHVRVVCNNTLNAAMHNCVSRVSFSHTPNIHEQLKQAGKLLKLTYKNHYLKQEMFEAMTRVKVDKDLLLNLVAKATLSTDQFIYFDSLKGMKIVDPSKISANLINKMNDVMDFVDHGCGQEYNRGSLYWAYMGVNSYINNAYSHKNAENKFNNLFGNNSTPAKFDSKMLSICESQLQYG